MPKPETENLIHFNKLLIPICIALPFNLVILKDEDSKNCTAVTEVGECPYAKQRHFVKEKFECRKDTLISLDCPKLA